MKVKAWVLYYKRKHQVNDIDFELNHYKFFMYKSDLAKYLYEQDDTFFALAIERLDVSNTLIVDKYYLKINNVLDKAHDKQN